jgi:hypothetical protein
MLDLKKVLGFVFFLVRLNGDISAGHECLLRSATLDPSAIATVTPVITHCPSVLDDKETQFKILKVTKLGFLVAKIIFS